MSHQIFAKTGGDAGSTTWQVSVKTPAGRTIVVPLEVNDTVNNVKAKIQDKVGVPKSKQKLMYKGTLLGNRRLDYYVQHGCTLDVLDARGASAAAAPSDASLAVVAELASTADAASDPSSKCKEAQGPTLRLNLLL